MEQLLNFREMECEILLKIFEKHVAELPLSLFNEILTYIKNSKFADIVFRTRMKNERDRIKKRESNKKYYDRKKLESVALNREINHLENQRILLLKERYTYKIDLDYYNNHFRKFYADYRIVRSHQMPLGRQYHYRQDVYQPTHFGRSWMT